MNVSRPVRTPGIIARDMGGETMLYGADEKAVHVLNETAKLIWDLCDGAHSLEDMQRVIRTHFAVPEQHDVIGDIQRILAIFANKGLLQPVD